MFVFGSFTEDETKSLLLGLSAKSAEKPAGSTGLQFGILNVTAGKPLNGQNSQSSRHLDSLKGTAGLNPSQHLKENAEQPPVKRADDSVQSGFCYAKENGNFHSTNPVPSLTNGVKVLEIESRSPVSLNMFQNGDGGSHYSQGSIFDVLDGERSRSLDQEGLVEHVSVAMSRKEIKNQSNGAISYTRSLLPRGIINSGNLCFLNATLQALLSCSPFVQLLQELRHSSVPKVLLSCACDLLSVFFSAFHLDNDSDSCVSQLQSKCTTFGLPFVRWAIQH